MRQAGFTILELLIVLSLIGIMAALGGRIYLYFQQIQQIETRKLYRQVPALMFDYQLQLDLSRTYSYEQKGGVLSLKGFLGEDVARYQLLDDYTIRTFPQRDTFAVSMSLMEPVSQVQFSLQSAKGIVYSYSCLPHSRITDE